MTVLPIPQKWNHETDVIIVGAGNAGLPAAIAAAESGAKVAVLEIMSYCASSLAIISVGPAFAGTDEQKAAGIEDSPERFYRDGVELAKGSPEMWKLFTDNQLEVYRWCKEIGMKFGDFFAPPGHSAKRGFWAKGSDMLKCLENTAKARGAEILFLHRAVRLIEEPQTGRVLGLKVRVKDKVQDFKARRAVVIASGGFGRNAEMVREYGPECADCVPRMPPGHLGDGLKMALELGAATKDIGNAVVPSGSTDFETKASHISWVAYSGGIFVNLNGRRFWDEGLRTSFYGLITKEGMRQPKGLYWVVYDEKARKASDPARLAKAKPQQANTIEELAQAAGIDPKGLRETIDKYNSDIKSVGYDTVFDRRTLVGCDGTPVTIDTPPYYAARLAPTTTSFKGGLKINDRCQVVDYYDAVIPGLYAAGEVTGGLWGPDGTYLPNTMVPAAMTFGRIAGKNAAGESPW